MLRKLPNGWIERTDVVGTCDEEIKLPVADLVSIPQAPAAKPFDPFYYPAAVDAFDFAQCVAHEREPPCNRRSNVGTQRIRVNAHHSVARRGNRESAERGPEERRWRHESPAHVFGSGRKTKLVVDEHRGARRCPAGEKEIESRAVGRSDARGTLAASREIRIVELPLKDNAAMGA